MSQYKRVELDAPPWGSCAAECIHGVLSQLAGGKLEDFIHNR